MSLILYFFSTSYSQLVLFQLEFFNLLLEKTFAVFLGDCILVKIDPRAFQTQRQFLVPIFLLSLKWDTKQK